MSDEIKILSHTLHPEGGDAVTIEVHYGSKNATILLKPRELLVAMTDQSWRAELAALASALNQAPISKG
jgi:hypothetical protein